MKSIHIVSTLALAAGLVAAVPLIGLSAGPSSYGAWGLDLTAGNPAVNAGDDFFEHANGKYLARTEIPADQSSVSSGREVFNLTQDQLKTLIDASAANPSSQVGRMYKSFMDEAAVETRDSKPLAADLARIDAIGSKDDFTLAMARTHGAYGISILGIGVFADAKSPMNAIYIGQGGLGMPDRDYYLTENFKNKKQAYADYVLRTFKLIKFPEPEAAASAVLGFETRIAELSWPAAERRDIDKVYNPMPVAGLQAYAPGLNWRAYLDAAGAPGANTVVLAENTALQRILALYAETPLATLKAWQTFHTVDSASPFLSKRFVDSSFEFNEKALNGTPTQRPRWKRGVELVDGTLGEAVGREYVAKYFPTSSKTMMDGLVANLKKAMAARIRNLGWMSGQTKTQALEKLSRMDVMIGYPVKWRDYSKLSISPDDLYGNVARAGAFEWNYQISKSGRPVDHQEWGMTPQTVNAYNGGLENKIVFPAGILQVPLFNPTADPAVNYGAIGAVIGHEITHGFDDQGRKIDSNGRLRDWWTKEDADRFTVEANKLASQYDGYEPVSGMHINGKLTLGENIADLGGLLVAIDAYHESLGGKTAPVIDGLTGDQRLLLAYAQAWRGKARDDAVRAQIASDEHSPRKFRVIGPTRNIDLWYDTFGVKSGSRYFLKPEDRVRVW
ncbi:MAG: M13 family metallopeptidase [Micropepsaceae bacterium]